MYHTKVVHVVDAMQYSEEKKITAFDLPKIQEAIQAYNEAGYRIVTMGTADIVPTGNVYIMMEKNLEAALHWENEKEHLELKKLTNKMSVEAMTSEEVDSLKNALRETADLFGLKLVPK